MTLAVPLLVLLDAEREPGTKPRNEAERRFDVVVRVLQWLLRGYIVVCLTVWFWQPRPRWGEAGFGPLLDPIFAAHEWIALGLFGALGTFLVAVALVAFTLVVYLLLRGRRASAEVVSDAGEPEFRFTDRDGHTHIVRGALVSGPGRFQAGQRVELVYLPRHPGRSCWTGPGTSG
jgi:hypothetical protein